MSCGCASYRCGDQQLAGCGYRGASVLGNHKATRNVEYSPKKKSNRPMPQFHVGPVEVDCLSTKGIMLTPNEHLDLHYAEQPHTSVCFWLKKVHYLC